MDSINLRRTAQGARCKMKSGHALPNNYNIDEVLLSSAPFTLAIVYELRMSPCFYELHAGELFLQ